MIGHFPRKIPRLACDLTALWKFDQLCTNKVETRLGVTGALMKVESISECSQPIFGLFESGRTVPYLINNVCYSLGSDLYT